MLQKDNGLSKPIQEKSADIVVGYRFDDSTEMPSYRKFGNKILDHAPVRCSVTIMYATSSTNNSSLLAEAYFVAFFQNFSFLVDP